MDSIFTKIDSAALDEYLDVCERFVQFDRVLARRQAEIAVKYYRGDSDKRDEMAAMQALEKRWYRSLEQGAPDYSIYDDDYFLVDLWGCWIVYSRKYLLSLRSPKGLCGGGSVVEDLDCVRTVIDLGCGFGYTTAGLKELFPKAAVIGTNLATSPQFQIAREIGKERGFTVEAYVEHGGTADLVFASEYFEHIQDPVQHLVDIVSHCQPRALVLANSFGSRSIGHFNTYKNWHHEVPNDKIGRIFSNALMSLGFRHVKTKFWNNRPAYWVKT